MDRITLAVLWLLGWRAIPGRDASGNEYMGFVRLSRKYNHGSYFHVYHEKCGVKVIRPLEKKEKKRKRNG